MGTSLAGLVGGGGGSSLPMLAPDLTYPNDRLQASATIKRITGIDASGGVTTAINLTGKYMVSFLRLASLTNESLLVKLTVDGTIIWNDTITSSGTTVSLLGTERATANQTVPETVSCASSFLLEVQTATDTSIDLWYLARPIE